MRDHDIEDPKRPQPVRGAKKDTNTFEDGRSWRHVRKDDERDRHRHL